MDRIKVGLDETRMIVLVAQVLLGFECRAAFEPGFDRLPIAAQALKMASFGLLIGTLAILMAIPAYHRIALQGHNTPETEGMVRRFMRAALWPFAAALGIDCGLATFSLLGFAAAVCVGAGVTLLAVTMWYALGWIHSAQHSHPGETMNQKTEPAPLEKKIEQVLTECRIVLPGTQALLGFQLSAFLTDAFTKLPRADQLLHLGAFGFIALSGILLMTPPAYHRVGEKGEMTAHFHRFASKVLLCAMLPLALGISLDFYIVLAKVTHSPAIAAGLAGLALLTFAGFWYGLPYWSRQRRTSDRGGVGMHGTATGKPA